MQFVIVLGLFTVGIVLSQAVNVGLGGTLGGIGGSLSIGLDSGGAHGATVSALNGDLGSAESYEKSVVAGKDHSHSSGLSASAGLGLKLGLGLGVGNSHINGYNKKGSNSASVEINQNTTDSSNRLNTGGTSGLSTVTSINVVKDGILDNSHDNKFLASSNTLASTDGGLQSNINVGHKSASHSVGSSSSSTREGGIGLNVDVSHGLSTASNVKGYRKRIHGSIGRTSAQAIGSGSLNVANDGVINFIAGHEISHSATKSADSSNTLAANRLAYARSSGHKMAATTGPTSSSSLSAESSFSNRHQSGYYNNDSEKTSYSSRASFKNGNNNHFGRLSSTTMKHKSSDLGTGIRVSIDNSAIKNSDYSKYNKKQTTVAATSSGSGTIAAVGNNSMGKIQSAGLRDSHVNGVNKYSNTQSTSNCGNGGSSGYCAKVSQHNSENLGAGSATRMHVVATSGFYNSGSYDAKTNRKFSTESTFDSTDSLSRNSGKVSEAVNLGAATRHGFYSKSGASSKEKDLADILSTNKGISTQTGGHKSIQSTSQSTGSASSSLWSTKSSFSKSHQSGYYSKDSEKNSYSSVSYKEGSKDYSDSSLSAANSEISANLGTGIKVAISGNHEKNRVTGAATSTASSSLASADGSYTRAGTNLGIGAGFGISKSSSAEALGSAILSGSLSSSGVAAEQGYYSKSGVLDSSHTAAVGAGIGAGLGADISKTSSLGFSIAPGHIGHNLDVGAGLGVSTSSSKGSSGSFGSTMPIHSNAGLGLGIGQNAHASSFKHTGFSSVTHGESLDSCEIHGSFSGGVTKVISGSATAETQGMGHAMGSGLIGHMGGLVGGIHKSAAGSVHSAVGSLGGLLGGQGGTGSSTGLLGGSINLGLGSTTSGGHSSHYRGLNSDASVSASVGASTGLLSGGLGLVLGR